ncbi:MAG: glycosyltransferase [Candidatus Cloacimonetes bacterium]|nr:glycosyltransferase [Candidatus Cloacimonadota bacterium]
MILHIEMEMGLHGGIQQTMNLIEGLLQGGVETAIVCRKGSKLEELAKKQNIRCKAIPHFYKGDFAGGLAVAGFARKNKISLIHCYSPESLKFGVLVKLVTHKPLVYTRRECDASYHNAFSKFIYSQIDMIVCTSERIRKLSQKEGLEKLSVIRNAIDLAKVNTSDNKHIVKNSLPSHSLLIGSVITSSLNKDYTNLVKTAAIILRKHPEVLFLTIADGKMVDKIKKITYNLNISDRFILTEQPENVYDYLKAFDIFILASKSDDAVTNLLDAMNCGKPSVCVDASGLDEVIVNRQNGLLVPEKDAYTLAQAVNLLIENAELRNTLAGAAGKSVMHYGLTSYLKQYQELYESLKSRTFITN